MTSFRSIFVALRPQLSEALATNLHTLQHNLEETEHRASICDPLNFHLTVAFCRGIPYYRAIQEFQKRAEAVRQLPTFQLSFSTIGGFDSTKLSPRVLFATPTPHPTLNTINALFRPLADRDQHPHLTLARSRSRDASEWMRDHALSKNTPLGTAKIQAVYLMANNGTPLYTDLDRIDLKCV